MKKKYFFKVGMFSLVFFLFLSFSSLAGNFYYKKSDSNLKVLEERTFNTTPGKNFELKASAGDVFISTTDSPNVNIKILGNEKAQKNFTFEFENTSNGVTVTTKKKDKWNIFNLFNNINLRFEITLPKNYNANVFTSGGDIKLASLQGEIKLRSSGGDITIKNTNGKLDISTSGGDITLDNAVGNQKLSTSGGDIESNGFNGNIDASTSGGDISLNGSNGEISASTSGGEVRLNYSGKNLGIKLKSSGGDVVAKLPSDFNAHADLHASGGDINCEFKANNVDHISSSKYEADLNSGGKTLYVKTSGGDINIQKR
jgi:DUF4097 and DUF4098 domain-containing protein YvlB